ncbi:MAG: tetratricopeptide repeat protein [Bacteroidales bacterium]|nr:tetratricopeptide repeat protein [Bacteroidales bacterium]MCB9013980.1 tetratricopeptide repeat protein [Bacteroidales bacterium]
MSSKEKKEQKDAGFEGIEQALTRSERFIEENQKTLTYIVSGLILVVLLFIGAKRFYYTPMQENATKEMFMAEKFFEKDSFNLALNGYGTYPGFLQIIDDYGFSKAANLAKYYAGVCYLNQADYSNAISYLNKFKTKDLLVGAAKYSSLGDAYSGEGSYDKAAKAYLEGANKFENNFSSPILLKKAGLAFEELKEYKKALDTYSEIKEKYPESQEGKEIDKYIARVENR